MGLFDVKGSKAVKYEVLAKSEDTVSNAQYRLNPRIELESHLAEQIYNALQGNVVEEVLHQVRASSGSDSYWRSNMEGHSLKVEKELLSDFYDLCQDVKNKLGYNAKVDFYITGDSSVNAFSVASENENEPNIVNINSGLFNLMTREELKFVIGHELGHLINKDTALSRLICFVFPPETIPPVSLQYKIRLHEQLAELVADRYGYIATEDLGVCITAFFKLASGLDLAKMNVSIDSLIADNNKRLSYFLNENGVSRESHPVNPIRVQALNLFANAVSENDLQEGMDKLISALLKVGDGELYEHMANFIASAGLIVAGADDNVSKEEVNSIISKLAIVKIFPYQFFEGIINNGTTEIFQKSVSAIMNINPGMRDNLLRYMIDVVMSDQIISDKEIALLYNFGESLNLTRVEVANAIAESIQKNYVPTLESIC